MPVTALKSSVDLAGKQKCQKGRTGYFLGNTTTEETPQRLVFFMYCSGKLRRIIIHILLTLIG